MAPLQGADSRAILAEAGVDAADIEALIRLAQREVEARMGVTLECEVEVGAGHAVAVVGDADQSAPAAVGRDLDSARAGVECVLDQFLDDACRTLDHLARGDAINDGFGELADRHWGADSKFPRTVAALGRISEAAGRIAPAIPIRNWPFRRASP